MAFLCDDVMATGEDTFSNGASGGSQALSSQEINDSFSPSPAGDERDDEDDDDNDGDDENDRRALEDISVRTLHLFLAPPD